MSDKCQCFGCTQKFKDARDARAICYVCDRFVHFTCARTLNNPERGFKTLCSPCMLERFPATHNTKSWGDCCVPCACGCESIGIKETCYDCGRRFRLHCIQQAKIESRYGFICYRCGVNKPKTDWQSCCRREWSPMLPLLRLFLDYEHTLNKRQKT